MRPAPFRFERPEAEDRVLDLLYDHGDDARILAGGQSLMPMLTMRLVQPTVVVDINRLNALGQIARDGDHLHVGALSRYAAIGDFPEIGSLVPLLAKALPLIAHSGVRNRGTLGGSVSLADPAAESPAVCVCLDATITLRSKARGERLVAARDFFEGIFTTQAEPDELLTAITLPIAKTGRRFAVREVAPRHGDFAVAGLCGAADVAEGRLQNVRLVYFGVAPMPFSADETAAALDGARVDDDRSIAQALAILAKELVPEDDPLIPAFVRQRLARTLLERALTDLGSGHD